MINLFKKQTTGFWILALFALWQFSVLTVQAEQPHDEFIQGYVTALVAMNYPGSVKSIRVDGEVVYIQAESLSEEEKAELHKMLSDVEGILRVEFVPESQRTEAPSVPPKEFKEPVEPGEHLPTLLPKSPLFQPLLADPRWPHFSVSFQRYINTDDA